DKVQAAGDFQGAGTQRAGFGLKDKVDRFIASQFALSVDNGGPINANRLGDIEVFNCVGGRPGVYLATAYKLLVSLCNKLKKQSSPLDGQYVGIDPAFLSALQHDPRFSRVDASGTSETLRNCIVGRAAGFDVLLSKIVVENPGK